MADLTGQLLDSTYKDLLQAPNGNAGLDSTLRTVASGNGSSSALKISTTAISSGNIQISGNTISALNTNGSITLTPNGTGSIVITGGIAATGTLDVVGSLTSTVGILRFFEPSATGSTYVGFQAPASVTSTTVWTLPAADGTNGQVLQTNGSRVLSFGTVSVGGASNIAFNTGKGIVDSNANNELLFTTTASAVNYLTIANAASGTDAKISTNAAGLTLSPFTGVLSVKGSSAAGALALSNSAGTFSTTLKSGAVTANKTFTLPIVDGTAGQSMVTDGSGNLSFITTSSTTPINPNLLHNGSMSIAQRGTSFTSSTAITPTSGNYLLDRWLFLTNGANTDFTVTQSTSTPISNSVSPVGIYPFNAANSMQITCNTANKQFAVMQPLENKDVMSLSIVFSTPTYLSLSADVRAASGGNTSFADLVPIVYGWTGTKDSLTNTVTTWNGVASGNAGAPNTFPSLTSPSWVALTKGIPSGSYSTNYNLNSSWTRYFTSFILPSPTAQIYTNLAVMFYCPDNNLTVGDTLLITNVKLEVSATGRPTAVIPDISTDMMKCNRFVRKSFAAATMPAQNIGQSTGEIDFSATKAAATVNFSPRVNFGTPMRTTPSITLYSPSAASAQAYDKTASAVCTSTSAFNITDGGFTVTTTAASGTAVANNLAFHFLATADL